MGFTDLWKFSFDLLYKLVGFFDNVVEALTMPIGDFIYDFMPNSLISKFVQLIDFLGYIDAEESLLTYILTTGSTVIIVWCIVKFFAELIS